MELQAGETLRAAKGQTVGPLRRAPDGGFYVKGKRGGWLPDGTPEDEYTVEHFGALQYTGPVRTETVTKRRIVPGVYGRLEVGEVVNVPNCEKPDEPARAEIDLAIVGWGGLTAPELDDLAMVASQLAEALRDA